MNSGRSAAHVAPITRRQFVASATIAGSTVVGHPLASRRYTPPTALSITHLTLGSGETAARLQRAAEAGRSEIVQTARLLNASISASTLVAADADSAVAALRLIARNAAPHALILAGPAVLCRMVLASNPIKGALVVSTTDDDVARCTPLGVEMAPSDAARMRALLQWATRQPGEWIAVGDGSTRSEAALGVLARIAPAMPVRRLTLDASASSVDARIDELADHAGGVIVAVLPAPLAGVIDSLTKRRESLLVATPWNARQAGVRAGDCVWVSAWNSRLTAYGADSLNQRFEAAGLSPADEDVWLQWVAFKAVGEAALRHKPRDAAALLAALTGPPGFDGHKGALLGFGPDRTLRQPLYVVRASAGSDVVIATSGLDSDALTAEPSCR